MQAVKASCLEQSATNTRDALVNWVLITQQRKPCLSLDTLARMLSAPVPGNTDMEEEIWQLDRTLYTTTVLQEWSGQHFWETIQPVITS